MSTHHARCIVCDEDCYCTQENPYWLSCGNDSVFEKPRALCSRTCAEALLMAVRDSLAAVSVDPVVR